MERMEAYREALKRRVCDVCLEQKDDGECGLADKRMCALDLHLAYLVQAVQSVKSDRIADYAKAIGETACFNCPNQDEAGQCDFRNNLECVLDSFAYLVVEAIEEVDGRAVMNLGSSDWVLGRDYSQAPTWATCHMSGNLRKVPGHAPGAAFRQPFLSGNSPILPHPVFMREDCLSCHDGDTAREEINTSHPERTRCLQCHVEQRIATTFQPGQ